MRTQYITFAAVIAAMVFTQTSAVSLEVDTQLAGHLDSAMQLDADLELSLELSLEAYLNDKKPKKALTEE